MTMRMVKKITSKFDNNLGKTNKLNRDVWLEQVLSQIEKGKKILDAGAGELQYKKFCQHFNYTSQDFAQYDGQGDGSGKQVGEWDNSKIDIVSDITDIPVGNNYYDAIMCIEVFEHIPEPILAIKEFSRILKQGGKLILTVPVCSLTHFAPYYFYNGYSRYWFEKFLPMYGFQIEELSYNGNFFEYIGQEFRRIRSTAKRYAKLSRWDEIKLDILQPFVMRLLKRIVVNDSGSSELLSHGLHIIAVKN